LEEEEEEKREEEEEEEEEEDAQLRLTRRAKVSGAFFAPSLRDDNEDAMVVKIGETARILNVMQKSPFIVHFSSLVSSFLAAGGASVNTLLRPLGRPGVMLALRLTQLCRSHLSFFLRICGCVVLVFSGILTVSFVFFVGPFVRVLQLRGEMRQNRFHWILLERWVFQHHLHPLVFHSRDEFALFVLTVATASATILLIPS